MAASKGYIEAGPFPAPVKQSIPTPSRRLCWKNSRMQACVAEQNDSIDDWMIRSESAWSAVGRPVLFIWVMSTVAAGSRENKQILQQKNRHRLE